MIELIALKVSLDEICFFFKKKIQTVIYHKIFYFSV